MSENSPLVFKAVTKLFPDRGIKANYFDFLKFANRRFFKALDNISFSADKNSITGVSGENGAGKTTLLKLAAGLLAQDSGQIFVAGKNISADSEYAKRKTGILLGERSFYWRLTAKENLDFFAGIYGGGSAQTSQTRAELSDCLNTGEKILNKRFDSLSSGEMKKISLIRTFIHNPDIILLDEPDKNLDFGSLEKFHFFLKKFSKKPGKTIFYISHNSDLLNEISDKIMILSRGKLAASGGAAAIFRTGGINRRNDD